MRQCSRCIFCYWQKSKYFCNIDDEDVIIDGTNQSCEDFKEAKFDARLEARITTPRRKK